MWVACHMGGNMVEYGSVFWGVYALIKHDGGGKKSSKPQQKPKWKALRSNNATEAVSQRQT